ncbi:unnamed protein product, partial [Symbiodinium sp. CCMP2592]
MAGELGQPGSMSLPSREFSSETLTTGLKTLDFQQIKQESDQGLDERMKDPWLECIYGLAELEALILKEESLATSSAEPPTTEPMAAEPATPAQTTLMQATPKSSAILSGPKKKLRLQSPQDVRKNLFSSPIAATIPDAVLEEAVGCSLDSGDAKDRALAWVREGSYEEAIDETIDEDLAKAFEAIQLADPYLVYAGNGDTSMVSDVTNKAASDKADGASDVSTCTAGFSHEEKLAMEARCTKLLDQATKLSQFLRDRDSTIEALRQELQSERQRVQEMQARASEVSAAPVESDAKAPSFEDLDDKGKEAARAKLRRFCQRKADGSLNVPLEVHLQWKEAGAGRDKLLHMFVSTNFNR